MVPYVGSVVVAVTVMHVLLFVLHVCVLREVCGGDGNAGVGSGRGVVAVSAYMGGTRGSGVLYSADDVLEMSVVKSVCGVCDMCICLARGGMMWGERIGVGLYQSWRNREKWGHGSVFWLWCCWVGGLGQG